MKFNPIRVFLILPFALFVTLTNAKGWAQQTPHVQPTKSSPAKRAVKASGKGELLFGTLPISTKSAAARNNLEMALDQYENAGFDEATMHAELATDKDPNFALGYALWSFAARRSEPAPEALKKAKELGKKCIGDECLLITFLVGTQEANVLPAITAMNDLLARRPKDKHILYLVGEWVFFQQDFDHATRLWLKALEVDPEFPPALNMLGYVYVQGDNTNAQKAVSYLRHYAAVLPDQANPQDSLGEVLRIAGDDGGSLAHYAEALRINPHMITSQCGRGDTYAMMGNFNQAKSEYEKALQMSNSPRDTLHIQFQLAMLYFWTGNMSGGRAELAKLSQKVAHANDATAQFEVDFARAILAPDLVSERQILQSVESSLGEARPGMLDSDRNVAIANVLREEVRIAVASSRPEDAAAAAQKLQQLADSSRNQLLESIHQSALGYISLGSKDYAKALEQLSADLHAPLVARDFVHSQDQSGNVKGAENAYQRLQYLRAPTAEWFLVSHDASVPSQLASQ